MRARFLAAVFMLTVVISAMLPVAAKAESTNVLLIEIAKGAVGTVVEIDNSCGYGGGQYYVYWGTIDQSPLIQGFFSVDSCYEPIFFTVPPSPGGKYVIFLKVENKIFQHEFTVLPSITLESNQGTMNSSFSVTGNGFAANETGITIKFGDLTLASDIQASASGSWTYNIKVPSCCRDSYPVTASGSSTSASAVGNKLFTVLPFISINPSSGWVGNVINVSGWGFGKGETGISVLYDDGAVVKSGITADTAGEWQTSFSIPSSSQGIHTIDVRGSITPKDDVAAMEFSVAPGLKVEQVSGRLGDPVTGGSALFVSGYGFKANEADIRVTLDGIGMTKGTIADAHGTWSAQFVIPTVKHGEHSVSAVGESTSESSVIGYTVFISPEIVINPDEGAVGENTLLSGTGFGANENLTVLFGSKQLPLGTLTDAMGNFKTTFKPPVANAGTHTIIVMDRKSAMATTSFTIESIPPDIPAPISPEDGYAFNLTKNEPIVLRWAIVEDPSGVEYSLEMSRQNDFSSRATSKHNLVMPMYTLPITEKLIAGEYYWRVRATDLAGNASGWSKPLMIKMTGFNLILIIVTALAVLILIVVIIRRIVVITKKEEPSSRSRNHNKKRWQQYDD